mmetsp:Transcript_2323/g.3021  ORF Transcript_2323/g.3021 Transcript_2323/m.3021 type:complete len:474 (+) Transcript_2323:40-1461(+)|eukprot:CAMPEP_0172501480 /NCGR_PEP_ID=MMETSP1066-20121228/150238_1 /TAXON_ID=671091 /ORGANISM="Coscinodiscus wailesii, Strain CCMP2513" /LENGTH=473 /DNA_ID=CAMNT_0013276277 /DNA_START=40 /DNA_END=1461 /DNA_ORIENTATION=-
MLHQRRGDGFEKNEDTASASMNAHRESVSSFEYEDDTDNYTSDEDSGKNMLMAVPSIENVVMGGGETVVDEEHYEPLRKHGSMGDLIALTAESKKKTVGLFHFFEGLVSHWYFSMSPLKRKIMVICSYGAIMVIATEIGRRKDMFGASGSFYGRAKGGENDLLHDPPTQEELVLMSFPGTPPPMVTMPKHINAHVANVYDASKASDVPLFWHIPRSGGGTVKDIMGFCLGLVQASDVGGKDGHIKDQSLEVNQLSTGRYVNVDTYSYPGLRRAKFLNLVKSKLPDVVVSNLPPDDVSEMFASSHQARLFTILRHPVERAISVFYHRGWAHWDNDIYDPELAEMSIVEYAKQSRIEHNWMVRFLSKRMRGDVRIEDLNVAKRILSQKCLIGLLEQKEETIKRFERYLHWDVHTQEKRQCLNKLAFETWSNQHEHPGMGENSEPWKLLTVRNRFDVELYEYAKKIFKEQAALFDH